MAEKIKIYSLLTRVFGNDNQNRVKDAQININGTGKLSDINDAFLKYVKGLGFTHLWAIGLIRHSTKTKLSHLGLSDDPKAIVKGEAGSPYAIKDYYDIMPTLADKADNRWEEFDALLKRVHKAGLKLMIDFVPNHLSRAYKSEAKAEDIKDFGEEDNTNLAFDNQNNFYYIPNQSLKLPIEGEGYTEYPAKATGNDVFSSTPSINDWFETIKLNYGIDYYSNTTHFEPIPNTWHKMFEILDFWVNKGVDSFRCDMAEMLPVEFWDWAIKRLKNKHVQKNILFLAEIYQKDKYRPFINAGFDYLYDKVAVYDTLKAIIRKETDAYHFAYAKEETADIQANMCYFLENHDEQRIASEFFAGEAYRAIPAMALILLSSKSSFLHYFGQELGERAMDNEGFSGVDGRTSIFDYWSLDKMIRFRKSNYTEDFLNKDEIILLGEYQKLFALSKDKFFDNANYYAIKRENLLNTNERVFAFIRYDKERFILIVSNFADENKEVKIKIDEDFLNLFETKDNTAFEMIDISSKDTYFISLTKYADLYLSIPSNNYKVFELKKKKSK